MDVMKIQQGIFAGTEVPADEIRFVADESKIVLDSSGAQIEYWPAKFRTPIFLEKFSPIDGWSVLVDSEESVYEFPDKYFDIEGKFVMQRSRQYTARLIKDGVVYAQASVLQTVFKPWALSFGEELARGALFDALGLSLPKHSSAERKSVIQTAVLGDSKPANAPVPATTATEFVEMGVELATPPANAKETAKSSVEVEVVHGKINANLLAQIQVLAAAKGITVPVLIDDTAARDFYRSLLKSEVGVPA